SVVARTAQHRTFLPLRNPHGSHRSADLQYSGTMKFLAISVVFFVALAVRPAEGQTCDNGKLSACVTTFTNKITSDVSIALNQTRMC
ncbi:hypothetical protein BaRGS_00001008, partial [Batillaria attramentaria]